MIVTYERIHGLRAKRLVVVHRNPIGPPVPLVRLQHCPCCLHGHLVRDWDGSVPEWLRGMARGEAYSVEMSSPLALRITGRPQALIEGGGAATVVAGGAEIGAPGAREEVR